MTKFRFMNMLIFQVSAFSLLNAATPQDKKDNTIKYDSFPKKIQVSTPSAKMLGDFNPQIKGEYKKVTKEGDINLDGYVTDNKKFLDEVMLPQLKPHLKELKKMEKAAMINALILFGHEIFQKYLGKDFYRWGGDLLDLDDPQNESIRFEYRYGLDCSGFTTMGYELAVYLGLLDPNSDEAVFSSKGFKAYCTKTGMKDSGGRGNTSNNFRVDTKELALLGREITKIEQGGQPTLEQLKMLQPGDIVGRSGHFGIIVFINKEPYYLESGGWVVPVHGGFPFKAGPALKIFAENGPLTIRRALPDLKK